MQSSTRSKYLIDERIGSEPAFVFDNSHELDTSDCMFYSYSYSGNFFVELFFLDGKFFVRRTGTSPIVSRLRRRICVRQCTKVLQCFRSIPETGGMILLQRVNFQTSNHHEQLQNKEAGENTEYESSLSKLGNSWNYLYVRYNSWDKDTRIRDI